MISASAAAERSRSKIRTGLKWLNDIIEAEVRTANNTSVEIEEYLLNAKEIEFLRFALGYDIRESETKGLLEISWTGKMYCG